MCGIHKPDGKRINFLLYSAHTLPKRASKLILATNMRSSQISFIFNPNKFWPLPPLPILPYSFWPKSCMRRTPSKRWDLKDLRTSKLRKNSSGKLTLFALKLAARAGCDSRVGRRAGDLVWTVIAVVLPVAVPADRYTFVVTMAWRETPKTG